MSDTALGQMTDWPVESAAAVVIGDDGVLETHGDTDEVYRWASVTKLVTALTVLTLVDDGTVCLADPAGPPGATIEHLLAHTSGLPFDADRATAAPGTRRVYSNTGIDLLADVVAARAGTTFADLAGDRVLRPLGMSSTSMRGSAAHGGSGSAADLARLAAELTAPTLVGADLMTRAIAPAFPGLPGVLPGFGRQSDNAWGLGFEIRAEKQPHWTGSANSPQTFGHFGQSGSLLWVDPVVGVALVALSSRDFGPWAASAWPALSDRVLATHT